MMLRPMRSAVISAIAAVLLGLSVAFVPQPHAQQAQGDGAWREVLRVPPRDLDPARFSNNALRLPTGLRTHRFGFEYLPPKEQKHRAIYDLLREKQVLEKVQAYLSPLHLPNDVRLEVAPCDGRVNAQFWQNVIKVCYEYFDWIWRNAPKDAQSGLSKRDAMIGPAVDVFLHEVGHAVLQLNDIPLLGNEEDAADYIATFLILQFPDDDARRLIMGASYIFGKDALRDQQRAPELTELAGRHSLPAQRYFNRLCMAYGRDPMLYADAVARGMLTPQRAQHCAYEYSYISDAFRRLVSPYIDMELAADVKSRRWFEFETPFADVKPRPAGAPRDASRPGTQR